MLAARGKWHRPGSMVKADRLAAIRAAHKARFGLMAYVPSGKSARPAEQVTGRIQFGGWGLALSHRWGRTQWLETPDPKPKPTVTTKHRQGIPALTVIAAKAPKKLVRAYQNAEQLLAERARR